MMRIDAHAHIIPEHLPRFAEKFGYEGFIHLEHHRPGYANMMKGNSFFREIESNCWSANCRLDDMAANNIDKQVISTIPVMFGYWAKPADCLHVAQYLNNDIAKTVQTYPDKFIGLASVPLQDPELAIQELHRCIKELGLRGVQIGSHINQWNLNAPELFPFFEACQELNASVFVHPWDMMGMEEMQRYWLPWLVGMPAETSRAICSLIFGGVFERLPNLRVLFSHGGGSFPGTIGRIEHGYNCRPDLVAIDNPTNPREYLGKFWVDSIVFEPAQLQLIVDMLGVDKVMLGSDYPFPLGELNTGNLIDSMEWTTAEKEQLLYKSALQWLDMA